MPKKTRQYTKTTVSLAPLTVDEALSALLKTPPPKEERPKTAQKPRRKKAR